MGDKPDITVLQQFIPMDSLSDSHVSELLTQAVVKHFPAGKMIFKRGQSSKACFYLVKGNIDLCDENFNIKAIQANTPETQRAFDNNNPHQVSAVTTGEVTVLAINKDRLDLVLTWDQAGNYLVEELDEDTEAYGNDWMSSLLQSKLLQKIPPGNIQQLFVSFCEVNAIAGQAIVKEGENGDEFFVIQSGKAIVKRMGSDNKPRMLATLEPGDFFGEEALIGDTVRNATVEMSEPGILMKLGKEDFKRLLQEPVLEYVTASEIETLKQSSEVVIIDVRLALEIPKEKRDGSKNIPLPDLRQQLKQFNPDYIYIARCDGGRRSELGAYLLSESGLQAMVFKYD